MDDHSSMFAFLSTRHNDWYVDDSASTDQERNDKGGERMSRKGYRYPNIEERITPEQSIQRRVEMCLDAIMLASQTGIASIAWDAVETLIDALIGILCMHA